MNRLLIANFMRIKRNKLFWTLCGVVAFVALMTVVSAISEHDTQIDSAMCMFVIPVEIAAAIFISIFFGTEYGDGTIRNKLVVGHDRRKIYFANLITVAAFSLVLSAAYMLPIVILGFPAVALPTVEAIKIVAVGVLTIFAFCSLFTMVSMIYSNKAGATVINLMLTFLLLVVASWLLANLSAPEFYPAYGTDDGIEYVRNPSYVSGAARTILQTLCDLLPAGQALQFMMGVSSPLWALPLYSAGVCVACSAVGLVVFFKKDIK